MSLIEAYTLGEPISQRNLIDVLIADQNRWIKLNEPFIVSIYSLTMLQILRLGAIKCQQPVQTLNDQLLNEWKKLITMIQRG